MAGDCDARGESNDERTPLETGADRWRRTRSSPTTTRQNDHDALMLGRVLRDAGAKLTLAYVRHATQTEPRSRGAGRARGRGAARARRPAGSTIPYVERRVVLERLDRRGPRLAGRAGARPTSSCSAPTTAPPPATCRSGRSAQTLLERRPGGAGDRARRLPRRPRPSRSTRSACSPARPTRPRSRPRSRSPSASTPRSSTRDRGVDLLVVGSRSEAPEGRVMITLARAERDRGGHRAGAGRRARRARCTSRRSSPPSSGRGQLGCGRRAGRGYRAAGLRTLVISDLHLGNRAHRDVLRLPGAAARGCSRRWTASTAWCCWATWSS